MSEKTEPPSPRKLQKAREEGNIPKSRVLGASAVTAAVLAAVAVSSGDATAALHRWTVKVLSAGPLEPRAALLEAVTLLARCSAIPLLAGMAAALAASLFSTGFLFHPSLALPRLERVSVAAGFKRLFDPHQLVEVGKALVAIAVLGWIGWSAVRDALPWMVRAPSSAGRLPLADLIGILSPALTRGVLFLLALGVADYAIERARHLRGLRMSRDELKREHKESEGDPQHKAHRKATHRQLASGGRGRGVRQATAVVVNPTHIAVALRYDPDECDAPYLVAKGRDADALRLREEAQRLAVPVIRDIPLARSLIHYDVGEPIPEELYRAAAAVLHVAAEQRGEDLIPQEQTR